MSSYRNPIVSPAQKRTTTKSKNMAAKKDVTSGSKSPTHHPPLPNKLSPKRTASNAHSNATTPTNSSALGMLRNASPSYDDKVETEGGENTYVVAAGEDSSSLSSLSDPSFNSISDSVVVVTPESASKQEQKKEALRDTVGGVLAETAADTVARKGISEGGEGVALGDEGSRAHKERSARKQWVEDETQVGGAGETMRVLPRVTCLVLRS